MKPGNLIATDPPSAEFKIGAVAIIDILGFRGIYNHYKPEEVLNKLRSLQNVLESGSMASEYNLPMFGDSPVAKVLFLSDTIFVASSYWPSPATSEPFQKYMAWMNLYFVMTTVRAFIQISLSGSPQLLLRGCITMGKFLAESPFIIGPAVDTAAEYEKLPDMAAIWLTESAAEVWEGMSPTVIEEAKLNDGGTALQFNNPRQAFRYPVPMKQFGTVESVVLNPFPLTMTRHDAVKFKDDFRQAFYRNAPQGEISLPVFAKLGNTMRMLDEAEKFVA